MRHIIFFLISIFIITGCKNSTENEVAGDFSAKNIETLSITTPQEPWNEKDLMNPEILANMLLDETLNPKYVLSIGFENVIKNSVDLGPANNPAKLDELRSYLAKLPKDAEIILYCGCCPFKDCPNIRPAMRLAKEMNFENAKLLDIENNIRVDWIDHGYPIN